MSKNKELLDKIEQLELKLKTYDEMICELVEYLPHGRTDTEELIVRSLRTIGLSDVDIKGYFSGNIIL